MVSVNERTLNERSQNLTREHAFVICNFADSKPSSSETIRNDQSCGYHSFPVSSSLSRSGLLAVGTLANKLAPSPNVSKRN